MENNIRNNLPFNSTLKEKGGTLYRVDFATGDNVVINKGNHWEPGVVIHKCNTPRSYVVQDACGRCYRRNSIALRQSRNAFVPGTLGVEDTTPLEIENSPSVDDDQIANNVHFSSMEGQKVDENVYVTRYGRPVKPPIKFKDYVSSV